MQNRTFRSFVVATAGALFLLGNLAATAAGRIAIRGENGVIASSSQLASEVGIQIMKDGGNAVDAAVATAFAMAVTWPTAGNIGGGGFLVFHGADGDRSTFDFREKAPLAAGKTMYLDDDGNVIDNSNHEGILAVGVPGTVAGLALAHERYGSMDWKDLLEPAIKLASEGIPITWKLHDDFKNRMPRFEKYPSSKKKFSKPGGDFYQPNETWVQQDLADTLSRVQKDGKDGFYKGETAKLIADFMADNDGLITLEDLEKYQAVEREPVVGSYRGYEIVSMPTDS